MARDDGLVASATRKGPWGWIQQWDIDVTNPDIVNEELRASWSQAFRTSGGLSYMWLELAPQISEITYALLEVKPGDKVLLIAEAAEPCGWADDLRDLVGPTGQVDIVEIIHEARQFVARRDRGRNGWYGCWGWTKYTQDRPDGSYDCVAVMQAHQHCDDWKEEGAELVRLMKPGRRLVMAEAQLSGPNFERRVTGDVHIQQWWAKIFASFPFPPLEIPYYSQEELEDAFAGQLEKMQAMEWRGIEMFWGRKPA